jgi:hypothetical protein
MLSSRLNPRIIAATLAFALGFALAQPAMAQNHAPQFTLYNQGSTCIAIVNVEPSASNNWGPDLLSGVMCPNQFLHPLADYSLPSCVQDVRVIYTDGHIEYTWGINVCEYNLFEHY